MTDGTDPNLASSSLKELSALLSARAISADELVKFYLDRIDRLDGKLNAFALVLDADAKNAAKVSDNERKAGNIRGPLHGLPIAIKDNFHINGHPTHAGSHAYLIAAEKESATAVQRLERAGMIVLGKTQTSELAYGGWGINEAMGTPWNPRDLNVQRVPGGSSSGSAVAVAASMVPAALGSDTGGSCRAPAAYCGCIGVKPTYGLIGRTGMVPLSPSLDVPGLLVRSIEDSALLLDVLIGEDPDDMITGNAPSMTPIGKIGSCVDGLQIGRLSASDLELTNSEVLENYEAALVQLADLGASITEFNFPRPIDGYLEDTLNIINFELCSNFRHLAEPENSRMQAHLKQQILEARNVTRIEFSDYLNNRSTAQLDMNRVMQGWDAIVTPTCSQPAIPLAQVDQTLPTTPYTRIANFLNLAALSVPSGFTNSGLPTAVQFMVRSFEDPIMLRLGLALENASDGLFTLPPNIG